MLMMSYVPEPPKGLSNLYQDFKSKITELVLNNNVFKFKYRILRKNKNFTPLACLILKSDILMYVKQYKFLGFKISFDLSNKKDIPPKNKKDDKFI